MKTILIAEDDPKIATALTVRLKAAGYHVVSAPDGFRSFMTAATGKPDLILMDVFMPFTTGFSVAQELKETGLKIPVIFITASKEESVKACAKKLGAVGYFEKPFDSKILLAAIAGALDPNCPTKPRIESPPAVRKKAGCS